jgi:hypothetical protein
MHQIWKRGRSRSSMEDGPVGKVAGGAREAAEELLELAEGGVAGEVGGGVAARTGELRLVAVEHGALVPTRHGCGCVCGGGARERRMRVTRCELAIADDGEGRRCGGNREIDEGFGGKAVEVLAGGGCCL